VVKRKSLKEPNMQNMHEEPKQPITVLGDRYHGFELYRWREAFMCFLELVWAGKYNYGVGGGRHARKNRRLGRGNVVLQIKTNQPWSYLQGEKAYMLISYDFPDYLYSISGNADALELPEEGNCIRAYTIPDSHLIGAPSIFEPSLARFARNKNVDGMEVFMRTNNMLRRPQFVQERGRLLIGFRDRL
jgi:hypothetical protein